MNRRRLPCDCASWALVAQQHCGLPEFRAGAAVAVDAHRVGELRIVVVPSTRWALSRLIVRVTAWTRQEIATTDLASAVRLAAKHGVKPETINGLLRDVGLAWDARADNVRSAV